MSLKSITPPAIEPVALNDVKTHLRLDTSDEDSYVTALIARAREWLEAELSRALITQTWSYFLDGWPSEKALKARQNVVPITEDTIPSLILPLGPLQSVTWVKIYDDEDNETLFSADNYFVDTASDKGRITLRRGVVWPYVGRAANGIEIQFVCGYGDNTSDIPGTLRHAILLLIAAWFENREPVSDDPVQKTKIPAVEALLAPYREVRL